MTATFIGIDLAWKSQRNPTGAVVLSGDRDGAKLEIIATLRSLADVFQFVCANATEETVVAIDAPLIIGNQSGQRGCETAVGKRYGSREASCHTSNLDRFPDASSVAIAGLLETEGFLHVEPLRKERVGRILAEVYPHAAMVALFDLPKTLKYKKGPVTEKRSGLAHLRKYISSLVETEPALVMTESLKALLGIDLGRMVGRGLKSYEDTLDSVFCAYLAFYFWYWGWERNELFGDTDSGYILNPKLKTNVHFE